MNKKIIKTKASGRGGVGAGIGISRRLTGAERKVLKKIQEKINIQIKLECEKKIKLLKSKRSNKSLDLTS